MPWRMAAFERLVGDAEVHEDSTPSFFESSVSAYLSRDSFGFVFFVYGIVEDDDVTIFVHDLAIADDLLPRFGILRPPWLGAQNVGGRERFVLSVG